jgi:glycosyltransferase involved in cell wall biosynthesis
MYPPIVYFMNTDYPNSKAHSIQVTKVLYSLSRNSDVTFICNSLTTRKDELYQQLIRQYGIDLSRVKFIQIPKNKLRGFLFLLTIRKIISLIPKNAVFYTRSYSIAKRLGRTKFLHKRTIILESHKKSGYLKEDAVENSAYSKKRDIIENNNRDKKSLQRIYKSVDGIVFTSNESRKIVEKDLGITHTAYIWHPLIAHAASGSRDKNLIFAGSLAPDKFIELLLDALVLTKTSMTVDIIGGAPEDIERVQAEAETRGIGGKLRFLARVPHRELPDILTRYKFGLSLVEGLKVADYVECGLTPVIPNIPMYREIFTQTEACFFEPDDPSSLSQVLDLINTQPQIAVYANKIINTYSTDNTASNIFTLIANCSA